MLHSSLTVCPCSILWKKRAWWLQGPLSRLPRAASQDRTGSPLWQPSPGKIDRGLLHFTLSVCLKPLSLIAYVIPLTGTVLCSARTPPCLPWQFVPKVNCWHCHVVPFCKYRYVCDRLKVSFDFAFSFNSAKKYQFCLLAPAMPFATRGGHTLRATPRNFTDHLLRVYGTR